MVILFIALWSDGSFVTVCAKKNLAFEWPERLLGTFKILADSCS